MERKIAFVIGEASLELKLQLQQTLSNQGWEVHLTPQPQDIFTLSKSSKQTVAFTFLDGPVSWDVIKRIREHVPMVALVQEYPEQSSSPLRPKNWQDYFEAWLDPIEGIELMDRAAAKAMVRRLSAA